jgi:glycosyltransferase involved in cell wall biosynthesis
MLATLYANIVAVWARQITGLPARIILNEQNTLTSVSDGEHDLRWRVYPELAKWFYPRADCVTAVSQGVADDLRQAARLSSDQVQVIYNPIVTLDMRRKASAPLEHPWFQSGEPPLILGVGRLTAQKAFDVLIEAFAQVRKTRHARLVILGEGEQRPMLEALVKRLGLQGDVQLPGFVSNPYAFMANAAVFVLSSRWEGLPTVLVEAMSLGTPVVATDCPSGPREILKDGKYGQLVPMNDPAALALATQNALSNPTAGPCEESWKPYELDFVTEQYLHLLVGTSPN